MSYIFGWIILVAYLVFVLPAVIWLNMQDRKANKRIAEAYKRGEITINDIYWDARLND